MSNSAQNETVPSYETYEKKVVRITGFTVGGRKREFVRLNRRLSRKGWVVVDFNEAGRWASAATFRRPLSLRSSSRRKTVLGVLALVLLTLMIGGIYEFGALELEEDWREPASQSGNLGVEMSLKGSAREGKVEASYEDESSPFRARQKSSSKTLVQSKGSDRVGAEKGPGGEEDAHQIWISRFGPMPTRNVWSGTYGPIEAYFKSINHDSVRIDISDCTPVLIDESKGWVVGCSYQVSNGEGTTVDNSNWFIIRFGQVVEVLPQSVYRY